MEQPRQRVIRGDVPAVDVVRDGNRDRCTSDQIGKRAKAHA
jgi:hypothetical protein